ncbi:cupin domain-containing protein [Nocardia sp. NPDC049220]|uniref:cupin domain-containing protein n=1 Tax=Nocardia sp. NPDC049220 TaxID=3155273 RepID=UPI0033F4B306
MTGIESATGSSIEQHDVVWHKPPYGQKDFWLSDSVIGADDYTSAFNAQLCKIGPGGGSPPHKHTYNHAFYVAAGVGTVRIERNTFDMKPGTVIKVPEGTQHSVTNTGTEDLVFITIYDPPNVDGTP